MTPQRMMFGGLVLAAVGGIVTWASYQMTDPGGTYAVAWGLIAVGAWYFLRGLFKAMRGRGTTPVAPAPAAAAPAAEAAPGISASVQTAAEPAASLRRCPFCAEVIQPQAILCRWCGRDLTGVPPPPPPLGP